MKQVKVSQPQLVEELFLRLKNSSPDQGIPSKIITQFLYFSRAYGMLCPNLTVPFGSEVRKPYHRTIVLFFREAYAANRVRFFNLLSLFSDEFTALQLQVTFLSAKSFWVKIRNLRVHDSRSIRRLERR